MSAPRVKVDRHRWVKIRIHVYICRKCGTGKVNAEARDQNHTRWYTTYHKPDGTAIVSSRATECKVGPRSAKALEKYAAVIALAAEGIKYQAPAEASV